MHRSWNNLLFGQAGARLIDRDNPSTYGYAPRGAFGQRYVLRDPGGLAELYFGCVNYPVLSRQRSIALVNSSRGLAFATIASAPASFASVSG